MITIKKYTKELNAKGNPVSHTFDVSYTDDKGSLRNEIVSFSQRRFVEERKSDTETLLRFLERLMKSLYPVGSDRPTTSTEFVTVATIKTELGDNEINT